MGSFILTNAFLSLMRGIVVGVGVLLLSVLSGIGATSADPGPSSDHITVIGPRYTPQGDDILDPWSSSGIYKKRMTVTLAMGDVFDIPRTGCDGPKLEHCVWPYIKTLQWHFNPAIPYPYTVETVGTWSGFLGEPSLCHLDRYGFSAEAAATCVSIAESNLRRAD